VRYQVSQDKDLTEIGKMICDYCLAPDTASGAGIGCDNMTVLIVALLQGRTKEEWYTWVKDRVEKQYGRATPSSLPQLYSQSRMMSFKARMETMANRNNNRSFQEEDHNPLGFLSGTGLSGFARVLGSTGGISFHPGAGIMSDSGTLMFGGDDSDEEEEEEEVSSNSFFSQTFSLGRSDSPDPTQQLKARLDEFERDLDDEGDTTMSDASEDGRELQGEAPPPSKSLPNGDAKDAITPVQQLSPQLSGDAAAPITKAEGFLDASEDPLKSC
jgi:protein phosphatase 2C family protein 2/3